MGISRGLALLFLLTILICLLFIKVADADSDHYGIHAVGHATEPFCPGGYSDRGDQCQQVEHSAVIDDDFDDTYKVVNKVSISLSSSESTEVAVETAGLVIDTSEPEEELSNNVIVLGH